MTTDGSRTQRRLNPSLCISPASAPGPMWSTSPQSTTTPNRRRTSVRRVIDLGARGRVRESELEGQHGPEDVRADRGQWEEPFHMPNEGKRQDEHRKVSADETVQDGFHAPTAMGIQNVPDLEGSLHHRKRGRVPNDRQPPQRDRYAAHPMPA